MLSSEASLYLSWKPISWSRVEKLKAQVAWSPVLSFHSLVMIWAAMSSAAVWSIVFLKPTSLHPFTKKCWSTSCFLLLTSFLKVLISFSSRIEYLPHCQKHQKLVKWPWCWWWLASNSPDLIPWRIYGVLSRGKMRDKRPKNADELKGTVKETWASIPTHQQCHKLINCMPHRIEGSSSSKGAPTK